MPHTLFYAISLCETIFDKLTFQRVLRHNLFLHKIPIFTLSRDHDSYGDHDSYRSPTNTDQRFHMIAELINRNFIYVTMPYKSSVDIVVNDVLYRAIVLSCRRLFRLRRSR